MTKKQWIGGIHAVNQAIDTQSVLAIEVQNNKQSKNLLKLVNKAKEAGIEIRNVQSYEIEYRVPGLKHQGVAAEIEIKENNLSWMQCIAGKKNPLLLILDSIQDPHNLGACLRTALAADVAAVLIPNSRSASINAVVHQVSCGASEILPIFQVPNLKREIDEMKKMGIWVVGAASEAEQTLYEMDLKIPMAVIMGNEAEGIRYGLREACDYLVKIPMSDKMESLNVSVACGVVLFEAYRQNHIELN